MSTKPPISSTFIFVDRRKTGRGKSLTNRQRLLDRIKDSIRSAKPTDIDAGGVKGIGNSSKSLNNPVKIARDALHEPSFHYEPQTGQREVVLIGNDHWERGDEFPVNGGGSGKGKGKGNGAGEGGGDQEDDFIVNISRNEFFDVFFEDCELPDLKETSEKELPQAIWKPAGFQKEGNAAQLSVVRSFRNSIGRRRALTVDAREELNQLEEEREKLIDRLESEPLDSVALARYEEVIARIEELKAKIAATPYFEKVDLRYRKSERVQVKSADAVLVMVMDISGSMDEDKKRIARKFFSLQYAFIKRKYPNTDLVFIAHTDEPEEMSEEEFFSTRKSGGTIVSTALALANEIISTRYDADQTNIYMSYASDGDNMDYDNPNVFDQLEKKGLLSKLRHAVYAQVGHSFAASYGSTPNLWNVMLSVAKTNPKMHAVRIPDDQDVFSSFKSIYGKVKK